jgi:FKBP-type peptidyl-prolyl cis-trans isomerase
VAEAEQTVNTQIPAALAYGKQKIPGIPPNSTLIFEIKLVDVK